jgi:MFS family permease
VAAVLVVGGFAALLWSFLQLSPVGTLRVARGLPAAVAVRGMVTFSFLGADAFVSLALHDVRGMSIRQAGVVLSSAVLAWTGGSWFAARTIQRLGPRRLVTMGMACITLGIGAMALVVSTSISPWFAIGAWLVAASGIGMSYAPLSQAVISSADPAQLGAATSALQLSDVLGFALGTGFGGALVALADRHDVELGGSTVHAGVIMAFAVTGTVAFAGVFCARRLHRHLSDSHPESAGVPSEAQA